MKRRSQGRAAKYRDGRGEVETWDEPARRLRGVCVCERKSRLCRGLAQERGKRCDAEKYETDETADTTPREREREKGRRREETRNERKETESGFGWECKLYEIEEGGVEKKRQSDEQRAASTSATLRRFGDIPRHAGPGWCQRVGYCCCCCCYCCCHYYCLLLLHPHSNKDTGQPRTQHAAGW
jgi:hypothetical protein